MTLDVQKYLYNSEFLIESEARIVGIAVILNVYSFFCGERDDLERLYILNDYSSVQYNVRRDELASFPSNSLSKARAVFKKMLTVRAKLKKNRTIVTVVAQVKSKTHGIQNSYSSNSQKIQFHAKIYDHPN